MSAAARHVLLVDIVDEPEATAAYEAWHAAGAVPGPIVASIRAAGCRGRHRDRARNTRRRFGTGAGRHGRAAAQAFGSAQTARADDRRPRRRRRCALFQAAG